MMYDLFQNLTKDFFQLIPGIKAFFLKSFAKERLKSSEYLEFEKKTFRKLAIHKVLNPISTIKFLLLTLLSLISFLIKALATVLGFIPFFVIKLLIAPLAPSFPKTHRLIIAGLSLFGLIPLFLFHTFIHSLQIIVEHLFSPVNNFIRPIFWNFFMAPNANNRLKLSFLLITAGITFITLIPLFIFPIGLPLWSIPLIATGIFFLIPPSLLLTLKILRQIFRDLIWTGYSAFHLEENNWCFYEAMPHLNFEIENLVKFTSKQNEQDVHAISTQKMTGLLFHSAPNCKLKNTKRNGQGFFSTVVSTLSGHEPQNASDDERSSEKLSKC